MMDESRRKSFLDNDNNELILKETDQSTSSLNSDIPLATKAFSIENIQVGTLLKDLIQHLGKPDEVLKSQYAYDWYVYAGDYKQFKLIGVLNNEVVALFSNVAIDSSIGVSIKSNESQLNNILEGTQFNDYYGAVYDDMKLEIYSYRGVSDLVEGIFVSDMTYRPQVSPTEEVLLSMEKIVFHLINGDRVANGLPILKWSKEARIAAYNHSEDMARKDYFGHYSMQGLTPSDRMIQEGIQGTHYLENLVGGYSGPISNHYALMHSAGHRKNILSDQVSYLGLGAYYLKDSSYGYYLTEDFFGK
jgi:uncharacterized protein YkwD